MFYVYSKPKVMEFQSLLNDLILLLYKIYIAPTVCAALYNMRADSTVTANEKRAGRPKYNLRGINATSLYII